MKKKALTTVKTILLDTREKDDAFITYLYDTARKEGYEVSARALEVGDVQYENIVVEIKRINDFCASVCSNRLWDQLYSMKANPQAACLVLISGGYDLLWEDNMDKIPAMEGAVTKILALGIPVIKFSDDEKLVDFILEIFDHSEPLNEPIKKVKKNKKASVFMSLPHVGRKAYKKLVKEFDTMESLCLASKKEICAVLGEKYGIDVYETLRA